MRRPSVHLLVESGRVLAEVQGQDPWQGEATFTDADDLARVIGELADAAPVLRGTALRVHVAAPVMQVRHLDTLPPLRRAELCRLVALQPGRFFRRNGRPLVTDATWMPGGRKVALLVALEEPLAQAMVQGASAAGLTLVGIVPRQDALLLPLSLLPVGEREIRTRIRVRWAMRGLALAGALWLGLLGSMAARLRYDLMTTEAELARLRDPVAATLAAQREMDRARESIAAVGRPVDARLAPALRLIMAGAALPDSAWLSAVAIRRDGTGTLTTAAPHPSLYLARLEQSGAFPRVRIEGRSLEEVMAGRRVERFMVRIGGGAR